MSQIKIQGTSFVRDTRTNALINTNIVEIKDYNEKVLMAKEEKYEINKVKSEIQTIKDDMSEIKSLMLKLLEKGSNV
jgi:hypothetical protein